MRLLVVEDDERLARTIGQVLKPFYQHDLCHRFDDALHLASVAEYGVIILDLGLPDGDGVELCRRLRADHIATPVLVLTGRYLDDDKVAALDAGADDYLVKPFSAAELMARLRALLRRSIARTTPILRGGAVALDPARREVRLNGKLVDLRRKEFDLLEYLMRHPGQVMTRLQLLDQVWDYTGEAATNTVDVHIKLLRDRLDRPHRHNHIRTVHGIGYSFKPSPALAGELD